jgi:hypothetical protein
MTSGLDTNPKMSHTANVRVEDRFKGEDQRNKLSLPHVTYEWTSMMRNNPR